MRYGSYLKKDALAAVKSAVKVAAQFEHIQADSEHLLVALMAQMAELTPQQKQTAQNILQARFMYRQYYGSSMQKKFGVRLAPQLEMLIENTAKCQSEKISAAQLLNELLKTDSEAAEMYAELTRKPPYSCPEPQPKAEPRIAPGAHIKGLEKYAKNLTVLAARGVLSPCYGRQKELERVVRTLNRSTKNNPCLIGEAGVGKTAIAEGLARLIASGNVPPSIKNKQLYSLDLASVVAGTKYRGDFEDRVRAILEEASAAKGVILFIDEVHTIIGAGAAEGAIDAANILKPALARGTVQLIGATTIREYRRCIEKDSALERRFQPITVDEPSKKQAVDILEKMRPSLESYHSVIISPEAIKAAVELSVRYIPERFLPDKAIDLLDDTAAGKAMYRFKKEKDKAALCSIKINEDDVASTVSGWTGIPVAKADENEKKTLCKLENRLLGEVIGQPCAVSAVARAVIRAKLGLAPAERPLASFLFSGPTGVGKSFLAKQLAVNLFGSEKSLFRFDMSEYSESSAVSKLIGAPPGYVGHDEPGRLTETVRRHPFCIVLFDEIEKAAAEVHRLLLQILEEGALTDSDGRCVNFKNCIIIATCNNCAKGTARLGFAVGGRQKQEVSGRVQNILSTEVTARFDETVEFEALSDLSLEKIAERLLAQSAERMKKQGITAEYKAEVSKALVKQSGAKFGARNLRRAVKTLAEDKICAEIINGEINFGDKIVVGCEDEKITIVKEKQPICEKAAAAVE